jgi:hypothetical protein
MALYEPKPVKPVLAVGPIEVGVVSSGQYDMAGGLPAYSYG